MKVLPLSAGAREEKTSNFDAPVPGKDLRSSPPAALSSTPRHGLQRPHLSDARSAERLRARDTARRPAPSFRPSPGRPPPARGEIPPGPLDKISPDTAAKSPGPPRQTLSRYRSKIPRHPDDLPRAALLLSALPRSNKKGASLPLGKNAPQIRHPAGWPTPSRTIARPSARSRSPRRNAWRRAVRANSSSSVQPRRSAPSRITSREQPAAKRLSLNFFFRLDTSMSITLPEGRIFTAAPTRPVSSSTAKSIFSISCSGSTSQHSP